MQSIPPDRSQLDTERSAGAIPLHTYGVRQLVDTIQTEDAGLPQALAAAAPSISAFIAAAEAGFLRGGRLIYIGAGTSGRLGVLDASEVPPTFDMPSNRVVALIAGGESALRHSSEGREDEPHGAIGELTALNIGADDSVLGIAAGGTTPYVRGALEWCAALPQAPVTGLLACATVPLPRGVQHAITVLVGPEIVTGSTRMKAGTATKQVLNTISTSLMIRSGRVYNTLMVALRATNAKLQDRAARIIADLVPCTREEAFTHLQAAQGDAMLAVLMARHRCSYRDAQGHLEHSAGFAYAMSTPPHS
ncbi:MAG: N-acetylmuramic acid 6-phosphate etherase [Planctomycetota bacterium]|nr:MAG: N-acetylmuramic acid 6-phosphate etherase [Planctomycetota bacterium]